MSIIQSIKKLFTTPEARHLKEEVYNQTSEWKSDAQEAASSAAATTREYASRAYASAADVADEVRDRIAGKIDFDTFLSTEIRIGTILSAEPIEKSDKLLKLMVDVGEASPRQIVSGIAPYFEDPQSLVKRQAMFVTNLEPKKIFGHESDGMIFALNDEESFSILSPDTHITPGTRAS